MATPQNLFDDITAFLVSSQNASNALGMHNYMKKRYDFWGVKSPECKSFFKVFWKDNKDAITQDWQTLVKLMWSADEREYQYLAMEVLRKFEKKLTYEDLPFVEWLITTKSWWDTVDFLASHAVGEILRSDVELQLRVTERYMASDHLWLQRTAIIFQLFYKEKTNKDLLFALILDTLGSKEFFINKATGWALRQFSKTDKFAVSSFIDTYKSQLSGLTIREGSKYL